MEKVALLSKGEKRIMTALTYGSLYKEIADDYQLSINTVKKHLKNAYKKMQVANRKEAVALFLAHQNYERIQVNKVVFANSVEL